MITIKCITCESDNFINFYSKIDPKNGKLITVVICKKCGTIQVRPRPDVKETLAYYSDEMYRIEKPVDDDIVHEKLLKRGERILQKLKQLNAPTKTVLEVGCGIGSILEPFKKDGSNIIGYELNPKEVAYGQSKGMNIQVGTIENVPHNQRFDVIIYSHVLEHLTYPQDELKKIRKLLNGNGSLVILLPGFYNMQPHRYSMGNYIVYPHLQYFSFRTLTNLLGQIKFKCIYGEEEIISIFIKSDDIVPMVSDYTKAILFKQLYRLYKPFYTPLFRLKRKAKKFLNVG